MEEKKRINKIKYNNISDLSSFPQNLDRLKTIVFNSNTSAEVEENFKKYYTLMDEYLSSPKDFLKNQELQAVISNIQTYVLSSHDYSIIRDSLIELNNYIKQISVDELYGPDGVYTSLINTSKNFEKTLNTIIENINNSYDNLSNGAVGKILPNQSITKNLLDDSLKNDIDYLDSTEGIYIDRSMGEEVQLPPQLTRKPIVIKIRNVSA